MSAALLFSPTNHFPFTLLEKCSELEELKQFHAHMTKTGLVLDPISASKMLTALCKPSLTSTTAFNYSLQFFKTIQRPNTFIWNTIIRASSNSQNPQQAILLYIQMLSNSASINLYTFPFLLKACDIPKQSQQLHSHIIKTGFASELHTANSLLHAYTKSNCILSARRLFDRIPCPDIVSWNSMLDGYLKNGHIEMARRLFDRIEEKNVVSWTSMINGFVACCRYNEALQVFEDMQARGVEPDRVTLSSTLSACAQLGALDQGRWIHAYIERKGIMLDEVLGCVLVDTYSKCGELDEALTVFKKVEGMKSVSLWTAMIMAFAVHGCGKEALGLFQEMERKGIVPNEITFTGVLTACSYSGLVAEGKSVLERMVKDYEMAPSIVHYGCVVDLLGRARLLNEAEELITVMPMKPNAAVWGALLSACRIHKDYDMGRRVGKMLVELDPDHGGRYVNLASIFAAQGEWNRAATVRKTMKERGVSKLPGLSSISLDGRVHEFFAGDWSHPHIEEIYEEWIRISERLKREGYTVETADLLLDLEEEEKESAVNCHSEKMAITFGLIRTERGAVIRIVKNLRVCKDCHTVSKFVSKVYRRKIIMRDRSRFHVFEDGHCSCRDYW